MPVTLQWMAAKGGYDALISLGCVIRGGTPHFDYVAAEVTKGTATVSMQTGTPITLGVLTTDSIEQAIEQAQEPNTETKAGKQPAQLIEMVNLRASLG